MLVSHAIIRTTTWTLFVALALISFAQTVLSIKYMASVANGFCKFQVEGEPHPIGCMKMPTAESIAKLKEPRRNEATLQVPKGYSVVFVKGKDEETGGIYETVHSLACWDPKLMSAPLQPGAEVTVTAGKHVNDVKTDVKNKYMKKQLVVAQMPDLEMLTAKATKCGPVQSNFAEIVGNVCIFYDNQGQIESCLNVPADKQQAHTFEISGFYGMTTDYSCTAGTAKVVESGQKWEDVFKGKTKVLATKGVLNSKYECDSKVQK